MSGKPSLPFHVGGREFLAFELVVCRFAGPAGDAPDIVNASWLPEMARCDGFTACWNYYSSVIREDLYFAWNIDNRKARERHMVHLRFIIFRLARSPGGLMKLRFPYSDYRRFWDSGVIPESWRPFLAVLPSPGGGGE